MWMSNTCAITKDRQVEINTKSLSAYRLSKRNKRLLLLYLGRLERFFFSTSVRFLEDDYMISNKTKSDVD